MKNVLKFLGVGALLLGAYVLMESWSRFEQLVAYGIVGILYSLHVAEAQSAARHAQMVNTLAWIRERISPEYRGYEDSD